MPQPADPYDLSPADAAEILGVHRDTITRWADDGHLACWRTPTGYRRFRRSDIERLADEIDTEAP